MRGKLAGALIALLTSLISHTAAQSPIVDRPLTGFQFVVIVPPKYQDGSTDYMGLKPYFERQLARMNLTFLAEADYPKIRADRRLASETLLCEIIHSTTTNVSNSVTFNCLDLIGRQMLSLTDLGTGFTLKGDLEAAIRKIAARLRMVRPNYVAAHSVDLLDTLPVVERQPITEVDIDRRIAAGELSSPIEGIWTDGERYRIAIVPQNNTGEYLALILESPDSGSALALAVWQPGMVKGRLTRAADGRTFVVRWADRYRQPLPGVAVLDGGLLTMKFSGTDAPEPVTWLKLRPATPDGAVAPGFGSVATTGTAFVCGPGLVATNYHVIKDAATVEFYLPGSSQAIPLDVVVADPSNDLAVLRARGGAALPMPLPLSPANARLAEDVSVIGFPLGSVLGVSHKVTTGVVSSLDGLNGDPRMIQLTAPIQPGSSGSPVFDAAGRVIGIVTATLAAVADVSPQNVNFAVKADYLALLLKRAEAATASPAGQAGVPPTTEVVERVRGAVGQIRAVGK